MRRTFVDPAHQARFEESGILTLPQTLSGEDVHDLEKAYEASSDWKSGAISFLRDQSGSDAIKSVVWPRVRELLVDHRAMSASFIAKDPGEAGRVHAHLDPTQVDESQFRSLNAWTALTDVDESNGCLWMLAGSHRKTPALRGWTISPEQWMEDLVRSGTFETVAIRLRRGDIVFFDHGVIHWSAPNTSDSTRVGLTMAMAPSEAEVRHCHPNAEGIFGIYQCPEDCMLEDNVLRVNERSKLISVIDPGSADHERLSLSLTEARSVSS